MRFRWLRRYCSLQPWAPHSHSSRHVESGPRRPRRPELKSRATMRARRRSRTPFPFEVTRPPVPPTSAPQFDLAASFEEVSHISSTTLGIVITPLGSGGSSVRFGDWSSVGSAWSTIKVPLAIAALRHPDLPPSDVVAAAITQSDNAQPPTALGRSGEPATAAARPVGMFYRRRRRPD